MRFLDLRKFALTLIILACVLTPGAANGRAGEPAAAEMEIQAAVKEIFDARALATITGGDAGPALSCYDTTALLGRWALSHEQAKLNYIQAWAAKRGVRITEASCSLRFPWVRVRGDSAELAVHQTLQLGYVYPGDSYVNRFGIGTRHWMELVRREGKWLIRKDFYTDGLGDNAHALGLTPADGPAAIEAAERPASGQAAQPGTFDREGAVSYADRFAGLAWGAGNGNRYNPRYRDLNDRGGDCTNFVSQCLAEGGGIPMDGIWFYDRGSASGSQAWVRAESFGDWLVYSGRGRRLARGTFPELNQPGGKFPRGAVRELQKGDVIGYGERGYSEHLAIVVGCDSRGYPLVNAHNVDRYHCPWDMGCDRSTVFHLYRINDGL
ncbi:MAG: amidase domain-containing protein [Peptococcaceae bacterium]|nr:amidase domain-containing protein [Peptococcaceae bacterium]